MDCIMKKKILNHWVSGRVRHGTGVYEQVLKKGGGERGGKV